MALVGTVVAKLLSGLAIAIWTLAAAARVEGAEMGSLTNWKLQLRAAHATRSKLRRLKLRRLKLRRLEMKNRLADRLPGLVLSTSSTN